MSGPKKMMLRVQSAEGTARVEVLDTDATALLFERVYETLHLSTFGFALHKDRQKKEEIVSSKSRMLRDYGLQHGDMLYLSPVNGTVLFDQPTTSVEANNKPFGEPAETGSSAATSSLSTPHKEVPQEDEVDLQLYKMPGTIQRSRDEKLCRHNSKGCCVHCSPLEPWDEGYLKEHNIKHMSFHSYMRKITSGKFVSLNELSLEIKPDLFVLDIRIRIKNDYHNALGGTRSAGCKEHPPWPRGICSKCQPGAVTLTRQPYRHVDNLLVEHPALVERFLAYWRATGHQRLGYLYGTYEIHPDVPLGNPTLTTSSAPRRTSRNFETLFISARDLVPINCYLKNILVVRVTDERRRDGRQCNRPFISYDRLNKRAMRRYPRAGGGHIRAAAELLAGQHLAAAGRGRAAAGTAGGPAGAAPRGLAVHRPAAGPAAARHRAAHPRRRLALPVGAGVHHGGPLPEPAPQRVPPRARRPLRLQVRHGLRDGGQQPAGDAGGLPGVGAGAGPGAGAGAAADARRARPGVHARLHARPVRARRLLQALNEIDDPNITHVFEFEMKDLIKRIHIKKT
ncbi:unnamed protein product [Diatraea saccharalis]|uniref:Nuclear protein localization protein 4 n=1 Tax=Diatraea saccharalis TaxID=40085 RepID=A0A9N9QYD9_9NEOP|nr:unnamed protein product [Diatraea saccharalis]